MGRDIAVGEMVVGSAVWEPVLHAHIIREKNTAKRSTCIRFKNTSYYDDEIQRLFYSLYLYKLVMFITSAYQPYL
jgi:hypothetical protein